MSKDSTVKAVHDLYPLPWTTEIKDGHFTAFDANGLPVSDFCDIHLGWTDTTVGQYYDPVTHGEALSAMVETFNAAYRAGQASPAAIPVLSEEEIERIADQHDGSRARNSDGTTYMHSPWGNGMKYALRYANTHAVTVEQIMREWRQEVERYGVYSPHREQRFRDRLTKLFNGK